MSGSEHRVLMTLCWPKRIVRCVTERIVPIASALALPSTNPTAQVSLLQEAHNLSGTLSRSRYNASPGRTEDRRAHDRLIECTVRLHPLRI